MTDGMQNTVKVAALIPARGGSKEVPGKNVRLLAGKPLLTYTVRHAIQASLVNDVFVTTDNEEIGRIAQETGAQVIYRGADLATDTSTSESALLHALKHLKQKGKHYDYIVFLQCTSPFRLKQDIDSALQILRTEQGDSLLSVVESHRFLWRRNGDRAESSNYDFRYRPRRQEIEALYQENGSIYIFRPWVLEKLTNRLGGKICLHEMHPASAIDIDSEADFELASAVAASMNGDYFDS